jgi:biotin synthase
LLLADALTHEWTAREIEDALKLEDPKPLFEAADFVRRSFCGDEIHRRGLIEFSNRCVRNCAYCGLRRSNRALPRYRMTDSEIVAAAREAQRLGYKTVVLQSGEDPGVRTPALCRLVERIRRAADLAITLSVGERTFEELRSLKEAGASRYLLRFETSDRALFRFLKPDGDWNRRMDNLHWLKSLGYEVGSGCMVGLPGQTQASLAQDLLLMKKLDFDMIGVGPFIPHPETPLKDAPAGTVDQVLRVVALVRLVTKNTHIPATTALGSIHPTGRQLALQCGANVIMPNVTPAKYRKLYEIYPNKICLTEQPRECSGCTGRMIHGLGRTIGAGYGGSLKRAVLPQDVQSSR